jgi:pyruvate formate lyase activating enzyme
VKALIFDIKRFAIHDGPGIRTTVFFKGCPMDCQWCHNPESKTAYPEDIMRNDRIGERIFRRKETIGSYYTVDDVLAIVQEDRLFYENSGGGVTFSGGEPMQQVDFLQQLLVSCKKKEIHTAVDTSGLAKISSFERILPHTDLFLFDIKHLDEQKHRDYTTVSNKQVLSNLDFLLQQGASILLSIPIIPGFNDDDFHLHQLKTFIEERREDLVGIRLLPYHDIESKYKRCDKSDQFQEFEVPTKERIMELSSIIQPSMIFKQRS